MASDVHPIVWSGDHIVLLDQTQLPAHEIYVEVRTVDSLVDAIVRLVVRGAPALGTAGGYGVALAMLQGEREGWDAAGLERQIDRVRDARPTAVNLAKEVEKVRQFVGAGFDAVLAEAHRVAAEDEVANNTLSRIGADWLEAHVSRRPMRILTHCNTGALATGGRGTALGVIRELHDRGLIELVYADETRPLLQGSRLTAWELARAGIPHVVQADGAATSTILRGFVDAAIFGADRIAANGDTANKIGSAAIGLACKEAGIPCLTAAPVSTVDLHTASGDEIEIELRDGDEVVNFAGVRTAPAESEGFNPAFDVTPAKFLSAIITERGVIELAQGETPLTRL